MAARRGDLSATALLRQKGQYDELVANEAGVVARAKSRLLAAYTDDRIRQASVRQEMRELTAQLAGPNPSLLERLLVERVVCCWLSVYAADTQETQSPRTPPHEAIQRAQDRAHRRFLQACKALAQVRKLLGVNIQVNIAEKQINVTTTGPGDARRTADTTKEQDR